MLDPVLSDLLLIVETAPGPIIAVDRDLRCVYVNPAVSHLVAADPTTLVGRPLREWLGDDAFATDVLRMVEVVAAGGPAVRRELPRGGRWQYVRVMTVGKHVVIRSVDSTASHLEHEALQESERRYRMLFEANPLPTFIWDVDTLQFVDVNRAAVEAYGWTREEFLGGMKLTDIRPPSQLGVFKERLERIRTATTGQGIYKHRRKDGSEFEVEIQAHRLDLDGRSLRVVTARDVTAERRAEEMRSRLAAIVRASNDAIVSLDMEGVVLSWNAGAEQIYGWREEEMLGHRASVLVPPEVAGDAEQERLAVVRRGESFHGVVQSVHRAGHRIDIALSLAPIRDDRGDIVGMSVVARDITRQLTIERQLQQSQKMEAVGRLAGGVAHDFNNMLTVIKANAELMRDDLPARSAARAACEEVLKAAVRAAELTHRLLAFSRQQVLEPAVLDLNAVVTDVEGMLNRLLGDGIAISVRLQGKPARVLADRSQLEQVLVNLAINARDAMTDGGELRIETSESELSAADAERQPRAAAGRYVVLTVSDTGTGMDDATRARVFEPFFTTKERGQGTGLGLATVLGVVEQSGGFVTVDSVIGRGTAFRIHLPVSAAPPEPAPAAHEHFSTPASDAGTVLLVEDDPAVRGITRTMLKRKGYSVFEASNGLEALELLGVHHDRLDLVITDAVMPQMSGPELVREIAVRAPRLPVLFMSGYTDDALLRSGRLGDMAAFLPKPFTTQELSSAVAELVARGRRARI